MAAQVHPVIWLLLMIQATPAAAFGAMSTLAPMWGVYNETSDTTAPNTYQMCVLVAGSLTVKCFGNINDTSYLIRAPPGDDVSFLALSAGAYFTCGLVFQSQTPICWGHDESLKVPDELSNVSYSSIASGAFHACALRAGSPTVDCWGQNSSGECAPPRGEPFISVTSGWGFSCGLTNSSRAICWGDLANRSSSHNLKFPGEAAFDSIFAGRSYACGIEKLTGKTICWGGNSYSQSSAPPYEQFKSIAPAMYHTCGLLRDSTAVCWGDNDHDQLNETVVGVAFSEIASGDLYTCGVRLEEPMKLKCWGNIRSARKDLGDVRVAPAICRKGCRDDQREIGGSCPGSARACVDCTASTCGKHRRKALITSATVGGALFLILIIGSSVYLRRKLPAGDVSGELNLEEFEEWENQPRRVRPFTLRELQVATGGFSEEMIVGRGAFGMVYRATLSDGSIVAIKKAKVERTSLFIGELRLLSRIHHANLVNLVGYCRQEMLLVFEFMANGSLYDCIFARNIKLEWSTKLKIAAQAAHGLEYLHVFAEPSIIHRDVKSANILLDEEFNAHVADFGVSTLGPSEDVTHVTSTSVVGTPGYVDPEYFQTMQLSAKSDVYSFGVVLLELLTGRKAVDLRHSTIGVVGWVSKMREESSLAGALDRSGVIPEGCEEVLVEVLELALACVGSSGRDRPTMGGAANSLEASRRKLVEAGGGGARDWPSSSESNSGPSTMGGPSTQEASFSSSLVAEFRLVSPK